MLVQSRLPCRFLSSHSMPFLFLDFPFFFDLEFLLFDCSSI